MPLVKRDYKLPVGDLSIFKPDTVYGYAYINGKTKPLYTCREITKGPDKGKFECIYLKKAYKYASVRLAKKQINFLAIPWKKNKKNKKLVSRDRS